MKRNLKRRAKRGEERRGEERRGEERIGEERREGLLVIRLCGAFLWVDDAIIQSHLSSKEKVVECLQSNLGGVEELRGWAGLDVNYQVRHSTHVCER